MGRIVVFAACVFGVVVAALFLLVVSGEVRLYRIPSSSMEPTFHCARPAVECGASTSDRVVACRLCYRWSAPRRGQIVAFHTPRLAALRCGAGGIFIKRVIGVPGDRWRERNGVVYIDGKRLDEPYVRGPRRDTRTIGPVSVGKGRYFLEGDNRAASCDSREWGTVPRSALIGRVVATYWPPRRWATH
jgi:signal peptidase I